ncbi:uncharacterized protein LOC113360171 [Papaver somniferum]|uniref:uncharacterized protein LOC113360171 n=1 Tax=Papaver somniferum TaxID=3469 RepID=UPI000E6F4CED|nr:uncharacterized protein LOC113360171 [Papaver somniferum]
MDGGLRLRGRLCVPLDVQLRREVLDGAHRSRSTIHPGATKMYKDLRRHFWWKSMKRDIAEYVSKCRTCQQVKIEHQKPAGELQPLPILVVKDCLRKAQSRQKIYADRKRRPLPLEVGDEVLLKVSAMKGVMRFGKKGKLAPRFIGPFPITKKIGNVAYQLELPPQLSCVHNVFHVSMLRRHLRDGERAQKADLSELVVKPDASYEDEGIRILERKVRQLRSRAIPFVKVQWNSQDEREASWEREDVIRHSHPQLFNNVKIYADRKRRPLPLEVGDEVLLKVSAVKGVMRFEKKGKLAPRFIGPFPITKKIGNVAYQLELPPQLSCVHNVFHVSMLRRHLRDGERAQKANLSELVVKPDATYEDEGIRILERQVRQLWSRAIPFVKVQWNSQDEREALWEREDVIRRSHPQLFNNVVILIPGTESFSSGVDYNSQPF